MPCTVEQEGVATELAVPVSGVKALGQCSPSDGVLLLSPPRRFLLLRRRLRERFRQATATAGKDEEEQREEDGVDEEERRPQRFQEWDYAVARPRGELLHLRRRHGRGIAGGEGETDAKRQTKNRAKRQTKKGERKCFQRVRWEFITGTLLLGMPLRNRSGQSGPLTRWVPARTRSARAGRTRKT